MAKYFKFSIFAIIFFISACDDSEKSFIEIPLNQPLTLSLQRFEQDLFTLKSFSPDTLQALRKKYPDFYDAFVENIIRIGRVDDPYIGLYLQKFVTDPTVSEVYDYTQNKWNDFDSHFQQLQNAFTRYRQVFPDKTIPGIITFVSGFNYGIVVDSAYLALGLDMFLGQDCKYYPMLALPKYKIKQMNKENMVPMALHGWLSTEFELADPSADLLTQMIHQGKILFTLKSLLPDTPDSLIFSFTQKKLDWCMENETQLWYYLVDNELLYSQDEKQVMRFLGDAPFVSGLPKESPGRAGQWLGYRIVKKYMNKFPQTTLRQLFEIQDGKQILIRSKYKPA